MKPSGYWWCAPQVWATRSSGSRLISRMRLLPSRMKPSSTPSISMFTSHARSVSSEYASSNRRMKGPMAQEALLSLALPSNRALRPSMSRRLTSLPSVAPTISARLFTASTISGSGLFQCEVGCRPMSAPWPTADIGCDLVKTSASGPMPTSMYCDHRPRADSSVFRRCAASEPGTMSDRSVPIVACSCARRASARDGSPLACSSITRSSRLTAKVTPAALIACRSHGASRRMPLAPASPRSAASISARTSPRSSPSAPPAMASRSLRSNRSATVGAWRVMSTRRPPRTATTAGPSLAPVRQTRPTSSARSRSSGSGLAWMVVMGSSIAGAAPRDGSIGFGVKPSDMILTLMLTQS